MLCDSLLALPEPILVATHRNPDMDAATSSTAVYSFLLYHGKEAGLSFSGQLAPGTEDLFDPEDIATDWLMEDYMSVVILDCSLRRVGLDEIKDSAKILVIDHHPFDPGSARPQIVDGSAHGLVKYDFGSTEVFSAIAAPSTASIIVDQLKDHFELPLFLVRGIYTDSAQFSARPISSALALGQMFESGYTIHDELCVEDEFRRAVPAAPKEDLAQFLGGSFWVYKCEWEKQEFSLCIAFVGKLHDYGAAIRALSNFADVYVLANTEEGHISFRSDVKGFTVNDIAKELGGGGHAYAAGARLDFANNPGDLRRLRAAVTDKVEIIDRGVFS